MGRVRNLGAILPVAGRWFSSLPARGQEIRRFVRFVPDVGTRTASQMVFGEDAVRLRCRMRGESPVHVPYRLNLPRSERTVACRAVSSDIGAFTQIFVQRQYDGLVTDRTRPLTILDCGANVGYASAFFLEAFPQARVIAIEPDADNFALLTRNLEPWRDRVTTIQAALWPVAGTVHLHSAPPGSLNEWGTMVDESRQDGVVVDAIDPAGVLARCPGRHIDVMKIDIEGAEALLFGEGDRTWMGAVDTFAIELHGAECERSFRSALSDGEWRSWRVGEITVARRATVPD